MAVDDESEALMGNAVMAVPEPLAWSPGLVTVTVLVMVQLKVALPVAPALSVTVMVTGEVPPVVGVPEITPLDGSIDRPGRQGAAVAVGQGGRRRGVRGGDRSPG